MLTNHKRRNRVLTLAVLTLLVGLPELAFAQQGGLFPNASIRRVRPTEDQEEGVYKLYRHQYYGYHPTCWRRFPDGWGCPSPEAPDPEKSFKEIARKKPTTDAGMKPDEAEDNAPRNDMDRPEDKPRPSPFDMPAVPEDSTSPFDLKNSPPAGAPANKPANPPQTNRSNGPNAPELDAPATGRTTSSRSRSRLVDDGDNRPMLAASDDLDSEPASEMPDENVRPVADAAIPVAEPAPTIQPPARRGMISGLFSGNGWGWRRR